MKLLDATPFPAAALSHTIPMTMLERQLGMKLLTEMSPKNRDSARARGDLFDALQALTQGDVAMDWEDFGPKGIGRDELNKVALIRMTKVMIKTLDALYEEALGAGQLNGHGAFLLGGLVERCAWTLAAKGDA